MKTILSLLVLATLPACAGTQTADQASVEQPTPVVPAAETAPEPAAPSKPQPPARRGPTASSQNAHAVAKPWIDDALQIRDVVKRDAAVSSMRAALQSPDPVQAHAGLVAFNQMRGVKFDKQPYRAWILPHLSAKDSWMRVSAMYALDASGREDGDLERVLTSAEGVSGQARNGLVHVIATFSGGELTGAAGDAVLKLISSDERGSVRQSFSGLWGTHVSPEIEKRLLDMSNGDDRDNAHDAIYFGLSTLREKSEAVVDRLIAALEDPDPNNSGRALWGLGQGVTPALQPKVADAMLQLIEARSDVMTRQHALRHLRQYGVERHAVALEALAAGPSVESEMRRALLEIVAEIRRRGESAAASNRGR